jgi:DNA-binding NarL/FixJ family response regulator
MTTRIIIVGDNQLFRKGLSALLSVDPDFAVVGDMPNGHLLAQAASEFQPDVVLMDLQSAGANGLEAGTQIKRRHPNIRIVLLMALRTEEQVRSALRAGADGCLLRDASADELKASLRAVASGRKYLSADVSTLVVDSLMRPDDGRSRNSLLDALTPRERSILQLVAEGRTNRGVAEFLNVSPKTIEKHRSSLMHKLGLRNAAELTLAAVDLGLIERPSAVSRLAGQGSGR